MFTGGTGFLAFEKPMAKWSRWLEPFSWVSTFSLRHSVGATRSVKMAVVGGSSCESFSFFVSEGWPKPKKVQEPGDKFGDVDFFGRFSSRDWRT